MIYLQVFYGRTFDFLIVIPYHYVRNHDLICKAYGCLWFCNMCLKFSCLHARVQCTISKRLILSRIIHFFFFFCSCSRPFHGYQLCYRSRSPIMFSSQYQVQYVFSLSGSLLGKAFFGCEKPQWLRLKHFSYVRLGKIFKQSRSNQTQTKLNQSRRFLLS